MYNVEGFGNLWYLLKYDTYMQWRIQKFNKKKGGGASERGPTQPNPTQTRNGQKKFAYFWSQT
jgi:hypothetical protein